MVDEAFGDYVPEDCSAVSLLNRYGNVIVTRTFSKGMGIADFRVGYGLCLANWDGTTTASILLSRSPALLLFSPVRP